MVDANAAYRLERRARTSPRSIAFDLMMIEQPLDYDDIRDHARLQRRIRTPICLDESLHTVARPRKTPSSSARAGSSTSSRAASAATRSPSGCTTWRRAHGIPVWHGGMLESGIGRAHNIHLSTLPNFTLPGDVAASRRYFAPDLIEPEIEVRPDGTIAVPSAPGIGVTVVHDRVEAADRVESRCELRCSRGMNQLMRDTSVSTCAAAVTLLAALMASGVRERAAWPRPLPRRTSFEQKMAWMLQLEDQRILDSSAAAGAGAALRSSDRGAAGASAAARRS